MVDEYHCHPSAADFFHYALGIRHYAFAIELLTPHSSLLTVYIF